MPKAKTGISQEKKDQEPPNHRQEPAECKKSRSRELAVPGNDAPGDRGNCDQESGTQGSE